MAVNGLHSFSLKNVLCISNTKVIKNSGRIDDVRISKNLAIRFEVNNWWDSEKEGNGRAIRIPISVH